MRLSLASTLSGCVRSHPLGSAPGSAFFWPKTPQRSWTRTPSRRGVTNRPGNSFIRRKDLKELSADDFAGASQIASAAPSVHPRLRPSLLRPTLFTILCAGGAYVWAANQTNADTSSRIAKMKEKSSSLFKRTFSGDWPSDVDLAFSRRQELVDDCKRFLVRHLGSQPDSQSTRTRIYTLVAEWWVNHTEAQRTCLGLIGVQAIIFLAWRVSPALMARSFTHYPLSGRSYTLLTSTFSHQSPMHFLFNSIAFYSFGTGAANYLWQPNRDSVSDLKESTSRFHFIALFLAAGVGAGLASHAYSLLFKLPRIVSGVKGSLPILPSLGASGSIYATVVLTALAYPDSQVNLIFFPFFSIPIGTGVGAMVAMDALGLVRGWRFFDHAAHLGGATCGLIAYYFSGSIFDTLREIFSSTSSSAPQRTLETK